MGAPGICEEEEVVWDECASRRAPRRLASDLRADQSSGFKEAALAKDQPSDMS